MGACARLARWRWSTTRGGDPWRNLATDDALLQLADGRPIGRLYHWSVPCLSLGYFQSREEVLRTGPRDLPVIRRLTGGGAILHGNDVTYAMVGPLEAFGGAPREAYRAIHRALQAGLERLGVQARERGEGTDVGPAGPALCFHREGSHDLVAEGRKLVGSAQRRVGEHFLQHGTLPVFVDERNPEGFCLERLLGRKPGLSEVCEALEHGFVEVFGEPRREQLEPREIYLAAELERTRYRSETWNGRR